MTKIFILIFSVLFFACSDDSSTSASATEEIVIFSLETVPDTFDPSVCPAEGTNAYGMPNRGTFIDERDGKEYKYTTIGNQVWMAENLNYESACYYSTADSCKLKGSVYSTSGQKGIDNYGFACPSGWVIPSLEDWRELMASIGGFIDNDGIFSRQIHSQYDVLKHLRTSYGWLPLNSGYEVEGTDDCGFSLLPAKQQTFNHQKSLSKLTDYDPFELEDGYAAMYMSKMYYNNADNYYNAYISFYESLALVATQSVLPLITFYVRCIKEVE